MTDKQCKYIESLVKKVFRNSDSQSEILSRLDNESLLGTTKDVED